MIQSCQFCHLHSNLTENLESDYSKFVTLLHDNKYLSLVIELEITSPALFFNAEGNHSNFRPTLHGTFIDQTVRRRTDNVAKVFTSYFKLLPAKFSHVFQ